MENRIEITDFLAPELDVYARLTENQLLNRAHPEEGMFIAESPKVIERALDAGCIPVSLLMETKHAQGEAKEVIERCGDIPVYTAEPALTFMPSTAMETKELPVDSTISRRFVTANLSAANLVQKMISQLMMRTISSTKNHTTITAVGQTCCQFEERYGDNL